MNSRKKLIDLYLTNLKIISEHNTNISKYKAKFNLDDNFKRVL